MNDSIFLLLLGGQLFRNTGISHIDVFPTSPLHSKYFNF